VIIITSDFHLFPMFHNVMTAEQRAKFLSHLVINVESSVIILNALAVSRAIAGFSLLAHFML
jgi:hypothetical protein